MSDASAVLGYHEKSKHRLDRYAPGPHGLDWANQPNPFREFAGAPRVRLPLSADSLATSYADLRAGRLPPPRPLDLDAIGTLFELALGISAWKAIGATRWALRCNPSSGNLHPTEGYLVCPDLDAALPAGVYHYVSRDHVLEQRCHSREGGNPITPPPGILIGLSSIHWREAWKYGMRAWRYCQHDCGHAIASVALAAGALGYESRMLDVSDDDCARLLGLSHEDDFRDAEREAPEVLMWIGDPHRLPDVQQLLCDAETSSWHGRANRLSESHVDWPDISRIEHATRKS